MPGIPGRDAWRWTAGWTGWARTLAWACLLGATGMLVRAESRRSELPPGVVAHTDLVYRRSGGREVRLDVYLPRSPPPAGGRPAVVAIHGGGWRGGNKRRYGPSVIRLAQHGYAVVVVDYLLSRPGTASWPGNLEDVREAVRWVRRHASTYGVDRGRIAALGASAGGHLAVLLGSYPAGPILPDRRPKAASPGDPDDSARVQAVVDFYGPTELRQLHDDSPLAVSPVAWLLGAPPDAVPGRCEAASPIGYISDDDAPVLVIHGKEDRLVSMAQSEALDAALRRANVPHRLIVLEGARHGFGFEVGRRDLLPEVLAFLDDAWARASSRGKAAAVGR